MVLLWLLFGIVVVAVAFLIPGSPPEVWPNLNYGGVATLVYVVALLAYTIRKPFDRKAQTIVWGSSFLIIAAVGISWTGMDETSHWQQQTLLNIRETIGRGIIQAEVPDTMLKVLDDFYHQPKGRKASLAQVFQKKYPKADVAANLHVVQTPNDSLGVFVTILSDTQIVLTAQEMFVKGRDPTFKNYNGRIGMLQEKFILTPKGVRHESEN